MQKTTLLPEQIPVKLNTACLRNNRLTLATIAAGLKYITNVDQEVSKYMNNGKYQMLDLSPFLLNVKSNGTIVANNPAMTYSDSWSFPKNSRYSQKTLSDHASHPITILISGDKLTDKSEIRIAVKLNEIESSTHD